MRDKTFHYTDEKMVKELLSITPIEGSVLDAGSGDKVWFNNLSGEKYECELERGQDFFEWNKPVDWVVGNPPFHISWDFFNKASLVANKGIAFLINGQALNSWTPKRYQLFTERGFYLNRIHVVSDKRWFGRYYYMIFTKQKQDFITWKI